MQSDRRVRVVTDAPRTVTRAATVYSWTLAAVGLAVLVALVAGGGHAPPLVPSLLLVLVLALCVGRMALYPSEIAATAELAVLLCAVTAFRSEAPVTGPLLLGLLVGPLDVVHWRQRSFVRMAYNSGNRALAALAASGAFAGVTALLGSTVAGLVAATAVGAAAAAVIDNAVTVGLVVCLGSDARAARRELLDIDALALPLAAIGGATGFLATGVGWWAAAIPLSGLAFVPELLQARARIPARVARDALLAVELVVALVVVAAFAPAPPWTTVVLLTVIGVALGLELVVDAAVPVPPVLGVAVVAAAVSVGGDAAVFAGALVASVATMTAWWCSGRGDQPLPAAIAVLVAAGAGVLTALVVGTDAVGEAWFALLGLGASVDFGLVVLLAARARRRVEVAALVWTLPLAAVAVSAGLSPKIGGNGSVLLSFGAILAAGVFAAWCGSTPWRSRFVSLRLGRVAGRGRPRRQAQILFVVAAAISGGIATLVHGLAADWCAWFMVVSGEAACAMSLTATRQWRFTRRRRVRETTVAISGALGVLVAGTAGPTPTMLAVAVLLLIGGVVMVRGSVSLADGVSSPVS
jgi:hypothetical protein